jgi:hypothetical protein
MSPRGFESLPLRQSHKNSKQAHAKRGTQNWSSERSGRGPQAGLRSEATEQIGEEEQRCGTRSRHRRWMRRVEQSCDEAA